MTICFYYITAREINRLYALALLAIFLSSPLMSYHSTELYSDQRLGVYLFVASVSFLKAMRGNTACWLLAGVYSTEALFTKNEALFFIAPFILSAIVYFRFDSNKSSGKFANIYSLLTPFLAIIIWHGFKLYYELGLWQMFIFQAENISFSSSWTFQPDMIGSYFYYLVSLENFNVIFFFFPIILLVHGKLSKEFLHLLFPVACYILLFLSLYMFTTGFYTSYSMTLARNILTYYPTICLLIVMLLKKYATIPSTTV
jgi:hypothetical protein